MDYKDEITFRYERLVTHLTRETDDLKTMEVLLKILNEKKITTGTNSGFIQGSEKAVCFQDAPLSGIAQNLIHEQTNRKELGGKIRYRPLGLTYRKKYVFDNGGRPVIYETKDEAATKFPDELWRVVTFDLSDKNYIKDWTHEREWRMKGDFELEHATVLLTNQVAYKNFVTMADEELLRQIAGIVVLDSVLT